ncbi:hypothetical protein, partial [Sansalvadorimonas verongulae]|uniref:hypothetical protein n=1 Tax=Sansalvadorimonas verongulae TaxID=2172824 RepID=UPI001E2EB3A2
VPLPLASSILAALAVRAKQAGRNEGGTAGAGGVPLSSTDCPHFTLVQYFYFRCRPIVVQVSWDC